MSGFSFTARRGKHTTYRGLQARDPIIMALGLWCMPQRLRELVDELEWLIERFASRCSRSIVRIGFSTPARLAALKDAGLSRVAVTLDGPDPETHDAFRRVRGSYAWTMRIIDAAIDLGLPLQINTTISRLTLPSLEAMAARVAQLPLTLWALFFLIQTGRGANLEQVSPEDYERVLSYLYDLSLTSPFGIKTTQAPHYQRIVWQRENARLVPDREDDEWCHVNSLRLSLDPFHERSNAVDHHHHAQDAIVAIHQLCAGSCVLDGRIVCPSFGNTRRRPLLHDRPEPE